ncbi:hypothetical protein EDB19DRAFT_1911084 [Suillus lakei]|nr:hypothetical protein EDB19DRAFT_1911084 [Suillus lakei]
MHFPWDKVLPKVIVRRLRYSATKERTYFNVLSTESGISLACEVSDLVRASLPVVHAAAGAIPLFGAPMGAAIGGLLTVLQAIDTSVQNKADLKGLTSRLHRLFCHLCNAPTTLDPREQARRGCLISVLQATSNQLTKLRKRPVLAYTASVTQTIAGCSSEIDHYLSEYSLSAQMQMQNDLYEVRAQLAAIQAFVAPITAQLPQTIMQLGVTLVDATGYEHQISEHFCTSFQQLNKTLEALFERDSIEARIQRRYMKEGQYDLCIDEGTQVTQLTDHGWPIIEPGTKIVMRVVIVQQRKSVELEAKYQCHFCKTWNHLCVEVVNKPFQRGTGCSIDCRVCKRRFQITHGRRKAKESADSNHANDTEMHLIRNFHVQQVDMDSPSQDLGFYIQPPANPRHIRSYAGFSMTRPTVSQMMLEANQRRRRHEATHRCEECGQTFTAVFSLKRHMQSHTGVRPFVCNIPGCNQAFFNQSDCRRHERSRKRHKGLPYTFSDSL